jgi:HAD superfamily hydrolase (TIGR01509 family)
VDARSLGALGSPRDELRRLLAHCAAREVDDGLLDDVLRIEAANWRDGVRLYDDVLPALDELRRRGLRLGLVSNCSWQTAGVVEATGLDRAVDAVVLSFEVRLMKPEPAILRLALERLGAAPARSLLVDDSAANVDGARAMGMEAVLLDRTVSDLAQAILNA